VLYLSVSPDSKAIVTGAGDETVRLWNVFSKARSQKVSAQFIQWEKLFSNGSHFFNMTFILTEIYKKYLL
jgi:WD40 repeat protein